MIATFFQVHNLRYGAAIMITRLPGHKTQLRHSFLLIHVYCTVTEVFLNLTEVFLTLTEVFPYICLSCKANARVKLAKTGHGPHSTTLVCICVVRMLLFVLLGCYLCCSMYCLRVNVYCHRLTTHLQLINRYFSRN
jgi:hypothetical protein